MFAVITDAHKLDHPGKDSLPRRGALLLFVAFFLGVVLAGFALAGGARGVHADDGGVYPTATVGGPGSGVPDKEGTVPPTASPEVSGPAGWEVEALRDLAEILDWPPVVTRDSNGRLSVSRLVTASEWAMASVRPFEYRPAAAAAFRAEQDDARLSGFHVTPETFYSYPAYWASQTDSTGQQVRLRLHWQAGTSIMGVEIRSVGVRTTDVRPKAQQLLSLAVQYGMPDPPQTSVTPSPIPSASATPTRSPVSCGITFVDVPTELWAYSYISQLACERVVSGYSDGTFRPLNPTSRAQMVKMLVLSEDWNMVNPSQPTFRDVDPYHVFYRFIETAHARGMISGYADGTFRPDDPVSRAQVAKMLVLARGWPLRASRTVSLCDVLPGHWAYHFVQVSIERGAFTGYGDGCFQPDANATRAQLAKVLVLSR